MYNATNNNKMFTCVGPLGANLCFQGTCVNSTMPTQSCECFPGYQQDLILYHSPSCTVPDQFPFLFSIVNFVVPLLSLGLLVWKLPQARREKSSALVRCLVFGFLQTLVGSLQLAGVYMQSGWYEVSIVLSVLFCITVSLWSDALLAIVLLPLLQVERRIDQAHTLIPHIRMGSLAFCLLILAVAIGQLVTCREIEDPTNYNFAVDSLLVGGAAMALVAGLGFRYICLRLESQLEPLLFQVSAFRLREELEQVMLRLAKLRKQVVRGSVGSAICMLPWFISNLLMGTAPYAWVFFYTIMFALQVLVMVTNFTLFHKPATGSGSNNVKQQQQQQHQAVVDSNPNNNTSTSSSGALHGILGGPMVISDSRDIHTVNPPTSMGGDVPTVQISSYYGSSQVVVDEHSPQLLAIGATWKTDKTVSQVE